MYQVIINLYSFDELSEDAQKRAIEDYVDFMESEGLDYQDVNGVWHTEFFRPSDEEAIEAIKANEYIFYRDGSYADCVTFTGRHPRSGQTVFKIGGDEVILQKVEKR